MSCAIRSNDLMISSKKQNHRERGLGKSDPQHFVHIVKKLRKNDFVKTLMLNGKMYNWIPIKGIEETIRLQNRSPRMAYI
jgi:hypothetical protein